ncbi:MAG: mannose-1-phosphate guanyltransferase [Verrucomicrobia bacterium CG_4_10_14_3_um_filter_43_23]|nr:MAG: mannose-1-phosphate guanyltransferase [Verrucomicrobia bacterium CG1_02_43_26]PIP58773.1 MAG: mannose-1-phosphate guanyltransferase [Verrucomicrobia bacterium CG22_combo_CG10-13_8_21_14_all_43_17]PIX57620.1 MAG: mannose-1-phosphate guanyltransferase [Verrucomicrobia bacterium CG_4_10_14_3_um_filter_43_23]PIY61517.1 MAG: mannose-1-phosphate guanyltransferase [Verrucomicrobia bacterium CG_4_10_14_0_8_um_filter_43_34]PJA44416.1 MAG: mannose-1-phosphate guanyltransferase [Verrucomicrobia ba
MKNKYVVIIAGGKGERFWPMSRLSHPKHVQAIVGSKPIIVQTLERLEGIVPKENMLIITNATQKEAICDVCKDFITPDQVIIEPEGRDTAAAVGLASVLVKRKNPDAVLAIFPADHVINNRDDFQGTLNAAFSAAQRDSVLVTIGIKPREASTSYGYIQRGKEWENFAGYTAFFVRRFVEKPDKSTATEYIVSGDYYWNAGMFIWSAKAILSAFEEHAPNLFASLKQIDSELAANKPIDGVLKDIFPKMERISIDYAVMEKAINVVVIESRFDWDDVGEWEAIARHFPQDSAGNVINGTAFAEDSNNNIIVNTDGHLTAVIGISDMVIVQTKDATLICPRNRTKDIKALVQNLSQDANLKKYT